MTKHPGGCTILRVLFTGGTEREYPVHGNGDWRYADEGDTPARIIVRPFGGMRQNDGEPQCRHEIPLLNVASVMVVPHRARPPVAASGGDGEGTGNDG